MNARDTLRARIQGDLDEAGLELTGIEKEVLDRALATAEGIERLEAVITVEGVTTKGNRGTITHPALTEIRHLNVLQHSLLKTLMASIEAAQKVGTASERGRKAARARWDGRGGNKANG
jgi:hypothetical protein